MTKEYMEFLECLSKEVEKHYGGKLSAEVTSTLKNNDVMMQGILLKEEGEQVAPNFYPEQMFLEWKRGYRTMEKIGEEICAAYEKEKQKNKGLVSEISFNWEDFKQNVYMRLVNRDRNRKQLEELPYREFLDMALVYYYTVSISNEVIGTMMIKKEHLKLLQISEEELHETAEKNTRVFHPVQFIRMSDLIRQMSGISWEPEECCRMYVLSNAAHMFGAVSMMFHEELKHFSEHLGCGFYILPSSIHEVILVPEQEYSNPDYFSLMVRETNKTHVHETEILSDSVYYYDLSTMSVRRIR